MKLVSLYSVGHPVPVSSQNESWHLLHEIFTESGWPEIDFSLVAGRWLVNGQIVADSAQAYELPAIAFRCHALHSVRSTRMRSSSFPPSASGLHPPTAPTRPTRATS